MNRTRKFKPIEPRFWSRIQKTEGCWIWTGSFSGGGYGSMSVNGKPKRASRISWELKHGKPWPVGMDACHTCDNPPCVNPDHIWPGTAKDNARDMVRKGRGNFNGGGWQKNKTHCKRGHEFTPENTNILSNNRRSCKICVRSSQRAWEQKNKEREQIRKRDLHRKKSALKRLFGAAKLAALIGKEGE